MPRNTIRALLILLISSGGFCSTALSHSGGTDARGCHTDRKAGGRHCHTPKSQISASSTRRSSSTGSSSSRSSGWPAGGVELVSPLSKPAVPFDLQGASGLSQQDYESNPNCREFIFSEILRQSDRGSVGLRCGRVIMSIQAHQ